LFAVCCTHIIVLYFIVIYLLISEKQCIENFQFFFLFCITRLIFDKVNGLVIFWGYHNMGIMRVDNDCCTNNKYYAITHVISCQKEKDVRKIDKYTTLIYTLLCIILYSITVNYTFISLLPTTNKKKKIARAEY